MNTNLLAFGAFAGGLVLLTTSGTTTVMRKNQQTKKLLIAQGPCPELSRQAFLERLEQAILIAKQKGAVLNTQAVMAQAAHESGWGARIPQAEGLCSNNLFGIKAGVSWIGPTITTRTQEWDGSQYITTTAKWRVYPSWNECLVDYSRLIQRLYRPCLPHADAPRGDGNASAWIRGLVAGPYRWATDPKYVSKVLGVAGGLA